MIQASLADKIHGGLKEERYCTIWILRWMVNGLGSEPEGETKSAEGLRECVHTPK